MNTLNASARPIALGAMIALAVGTTGTTRAAEPEKAVAPASPHGSPHGPGGPGGSPHGRGGPHGGGPSGPAVPATTIPDSFPDYPEAIASFGAAVLDGSVYVFGGHTGKAHDHTTANLSRAFRRLSLDAPGAAWETLPGEGGLQGLGVVAINGRIVRVGGMKPLGAPGEPPNTVSVDEVSAFDPKTGEWKALPALPSPRSSHDAVAVGTVIHVLGGWHLTGASVDATWAGDALSLDLSQIMPKWVSTPAPFKRRALAVAEAGGLIHALGGMTEDEEMSGSLDIWNPSTGEWTKGPDFPGRPFGLSAIGVGGAIVASGMDGRIWRLEAGAKEWTPVGQFGTPVFFQRLIDAGDGKLLSIAGETGRGHTGALEMAAIAPAAPATGASSEGASAQVDPRIEVVAIPFPGEAKNRYALFHHDDALYLFGGNNSLEQHDFAAHNFVKQGWRVDLKTREIRPLAELPTARQSMQTVIVERFGKAYGYAIGGFGFAPGEKAARTQNEILRYDFAADTWTKLDAKLPLPLTQYGLVMRGGSVYVMGGMDFDPARGAQGQFQLVLDVFKWNLAAGDDAAFEKTDIVMPRARRAAGIGVVGDRAYFFGGLADGFASVEEVDAYDFAKGEWREATAPAKYRVSPEIATIDGRVFVAGGSSEVDGDIRPDPSIDVFDPEADGGKGAWSRFMEKFPTTLAHARVVEDGGRLLVVTLQAEPGTLRLAWVKP